MATHDEREILKIIEEEAGESGKLSEVKISRFMGLRLDYIRSILGSMGRRDLVDVSASGMINIVDKGWKALGKTPPSPWGGLATDVNTPPEPPEDKYQRWLTGKKPKKEKKKKEEPEKRSRKDPMSYYRSYAELSPEERLETWKTRSGGLEAPNE